MERFHTVRSINLLCLPYPFELYGSIFRVEPEATVLHVYGMVDYLFWNCGDRIWISFLGLGYN